MTNDNFDYLNNDVIEWAADREYLDEMSSDAVEWLTTVRDEYLPEFEAAVWKLAAQNAKA